MEQLPQTLSSSTAFEGLVFRVHVDTVRYEDGSEHRFDAVEHQGSVGVIATLPGEQILLVRQYRHPFAHMLWEIPAGRIEPRELPADAAARELSEETGYRAQRIARVGTFAVTPGYCSEILHLIHADDLLVGEQSLDEDERIAVRACTLDEAEKLTLAGEIADMKTALALAWLRARRYQVPATNVDM